MHWSGRVRCFKCGMGVKHAKEKKTEQKLHVLTHDKQVETVLVGMRVDLLW